jgi:phosphoribosylaminoimidazolecarboxamide formyltransferase/IMP cyclohydrolase
VPSKNEYKPLLDIITKNGAQTTKEERRWFATRAFGVSSHYDTAIHAYFEGK